MRVEEKLNVTAEEFYDALINSLNQTVKFYTKKDAILKPGFSYDQELLTKTKSSRIAKTTITCLDRPKKYEVSVKTNLDETIICINIKKIDENSIVVTHIETYKSKNKKLDYNHSLVNFFFKPFSKRKMKKKLKAIEAYIISKRVIDDSK